MNNNEYSNSDQKAKEGFSHTKGSTVLITGNGFDLQCGLKSRYSDFFAWCETNVKGFKRFKEARYSTFNSQGLIQGAVQENKELTIWDLYFMYKAELHGGNWCDIELEINNSIQSGFWNSVLDNINRFQKEGDWGDYIVKSEWFFSWMMNEKYWANNNWQLKLNNYPDHMIKTVQVTYEEFYDSLLKELNIFEKRFGDYLKVEVEKHSNYNDLQYGLLRQLIKKTTGDIDFKLITFNYTPIHPQIQSLNIHGTLSVPIFGISNSNNRNVNGQFFTKSARRMREDLTILNDFVSKDNYSLVFYGVSFNDLDFDYYKMIIDSYGNGTMYFCYSDYDNTRRRQEFELMVKKLIDKLSIGEFYNLREQGKIRIVKIDFE